jgi:fluoride exporter
LGTPTYDNLLREAREARDRYVSGPGFGSDDSGTIDLSAATRAHLSAKKTLPLYIVLAIGFCGSFTTFSSFVGDIFLALANDMAPVNVPHNGGYSFMAVPAVRILTVSLSLAGLFVGAHIAIALQPFTPSLPFAFTRRIIDRVFVLLGWGSWLGAVLLCALHPDGGGMSPETWRGRALVFAPIGCLGRFYASLYLNGRFTAFLLGTFAINTLSTLVLGVSWDLAHVPFGGFVGCQV